MIFVSQTACGLKSFREEQRFEFPQKSGLFYMFGENKVRPRLGANGAGKSNLWDCLCWTLYGKTVRGQRAADVRTWGKKGKHYGVTEFLGSDGKEHEVRRSMAPNKLFLDGRLVEQEELQETLRIPYEAFLYSVIFGQVNAKFFNLRPSEKLNLFTEILDLDVWLERSRRAAEAVTKIEKKQARLSGLTVSARASADQAAETLLDCERRRREHEKGRLKRLKEFKAKLKGKQAQMRRTEKELKNLLMHKDSLADQLSEIGDQCHIEAQSLARYEAEFSRLNKEMGIIVGKKMAQKDNYLFLRRYRHKDGGVCDRCGQPVSLKFVRKRLAQLREKMYKHDRSIDPITKRQSTLQNKINILTDVVRRLEQDNRKAVRELADVKQKIAVSKNDLESLKREAVDIEDSIKQNKKEESPFAALEKKARRLIGETRRSLGLYERLGTYWETDLSFARYWVKGFKQVRLFLITEYLAQFEIEVNNLLAGLGMPDWNVSMAVESETKKKTIKRGFAVMINSPENPKPVSWESWSGGESQRLLIAGSGGLASLILNRYGVFPNIEVWDEPSTFLSEEGIFDLLDTLRLRAHQEGKQIWVVDQRFLEYGNFDGMVTVVKDKKGSWLKGDL